MAFAGDLKKLPLADVFQSIHQNGMSGALAIRDGRGERLVAFEAGLVKCCVLPEGQARNLAEELVRRGMVESDVVRPSRFFRRNLKKTLQKRNVLDSSEFESFARQVVLERVYDCFLLEEGSFEFLESYDQSRFDEDELAAGLKIGANEILMEAMRRVDEWKRIRRSIPSFREVYVATREASEDDPELVQGILALTASGNMDLEGVIDALPQHRFRCTEMVMQLVNEGALRVATAPEYTDLGKAAEAKGDLETAANHYARGLFYERGNQELNQRLIGILERQGKRQFAADELKRFAGVLLEQGQRDKAVQLYGRAAELAASDPLPLERLLDLQVEGKEREAALKTAERLVGVYLQLGLGEKAKAVYPRLLMLEPRDRVLRERLAETHARLHEGVAAATIYKELAQEQLELGDQVAASRSLKRATELAPDDTKAAHLLKDIVSGEHAQRRARRQRYVVLGALWLVLGGAVGWLCYEGLALAYLRDANRAALGEIDRGPEGVLAALVAYQATRDAFPHAWAARWADESLEGLSHLYLREVERSGQSLLLGPPQPHPEPNQAVVERLDRALAPEGQTPLDELVRAAEEAALAAGQDLDPAQAEEHAAQAGQLAREGLLRVSEARLALVRASVQARRMHEVRLLQALPVLHLVAARAAVHHPASRRLLDEALRRRQGS